MSWIIGLALLTGLVVVWGSLRSRRATPYDDPGLRYDVFLSYKSEDVHLVRRIADRLIASGLRVWFAEYIILLQHRDQFDAAIAHGTANSRCGILFTNDAYWCSKHTRKEAQQLLDRLDARSDQEQVKVLEVQLSHKPLSGDALPELKRLGPDDRFTVAASGPPDPEAILRFIEDRVPQLLVLHDRIVHDVPSKSSKFATSGDEWRFEIDVTNWQLSSRARGFDGDGNFDGPMYRRRLGGCRTRLHIQFGLDGSAKRLLVKLDTKAALDDRQVVNELIAFAADYVVRRHYNAAGVHLLFQHGYSHAVFTYWNWLRGAWVRRYSIILPHPLKPDTNCELALHFEFRGSFRKLCTVTDSMDNVARSVRFERQDWISGKPENPRNIPYNDAAG